MIADGRSMRPQMPGEYHWINLTAGINHRLGSSYTIEQVQQMPSDQLLLLEILLEAERKS